MCGRARCTMRADDFVRASHLRNSRSVRRINMERYQPSYNVAPGFNVPVIYRDSEGDDNGVILHCMKWGLIPSFTKKNEKIDHFKMFNARAESIKEKPSFCRLIPKNRCLVSVEGFYEWKKDGSKKQPYYIHFKDGRPLVFAALFDSWKNSEGDVMYTFTIITTSASASLKWLHGCLSSWGDKESTECWLDDTPSPDLSKLLKPYEGKYLVWYPVTPAIGKISFDGPDCVREVKPEHPRSISQFFTKKEVHKPKHEGIPVEGEAGEAAELKNARSTLVTGFKGESCEDDATEVKVEAESLNEHNLSLKNEDSYDKQGDSFPGTKRGNSDISGLDMAFDVEDQTGSRRKKSRSSSDSQPTLLSFFGRRQ